MKKILSIILIFTILLNYVNISYGYSEKNEVPENTNSINIQIEFYDEFKVNMKNINFANSIQSFTIAVNLIIPEVV